ncbi:hypothetical protein HK101_003236 [Irineochytrium annulatum]|nr:hypothetical protein HK101_003236 [Irineochytrium annulatum]
MASSPLEMQPLSPTSSSESSAAAVPEDSARPSTLSSTAPFSRDDPIPPDTAVPTDVEADVAALATSTLASSDTFWRRHKDTIWNVLRIAIINLALPNVIYYVASTPMHVATTWALLISGVPSMVEALVVMVTRRKIDAIAVTVLLGISLSFVIVFTSNDPKLLILKDSFFTLLNGVAFLVSVCFSENLMWYYNRNFVGWNDQAAQDRLTARWNEGPWVRATTNVMCYVWGVTYILEAAARVVMIYMLPMDFVIYVSPWLFSAVSVLLWAWCYFYVKFLEYKYAKFLDAQAKARREKEGMEGGARDEDGESVEGDAEKGPPRREEDDAGVAEKSDAESDVEKEMARLEDGPELTIIVEGDSEELE